MKKYFYKLLVKYFSFHVRPSDSFVDVNPTNDFLYDNLNSKEKGKYRLETVDYSSNDHTYSQNTFPVKNPDYVILNGNIHYERDIQSFFEALHGMCQPETRVLIAYYSSLWKPLFKLATFLGLRIKNPEKNWIAPEDIDNILLLSNFQLVSTQSRCLIPIWIPLISNFVNYFISPLPFFRIFNMFHIAVARPIFTNRYPKNASVSIVIPARNEELNIENIVKRIPRMSDDDEIIFIEGNSTDSTWEKIKEVSEKYGTERKIVITQQEGKGKGNAVRKGFTLASKDILMILDADMTVPPEELPKFYKAIISNSGEFINGSRLVYPMEKKAMRFINMVGNKLFAQAFSYVLGQRFKDTLCGTKVLSRKNYQRIARNRSFFGNFDPFGDFDLLFGASRMGLKIVELPITYKERVYGKTNIARWRHGIILLRMLFFAARKIKFF